jgi:hypothetical protein
MGTVRLVAGSGRSFLHPIPDRVENSAGNPWGGSSPVPHPPWFLFIVPRKICAIERTDEPRARAKGHEHGPDMSDRPGFRNFYDCGAEMALRYPADRSCRLDHDFFPTALLPFFRPMLTFVIFSLSRVREP